MFWNGEYFFVPHYKNIFVLKQFVLMMKSDNVAILVNVTWCLFLERAEIYCKFTGSEIQYISDVGEHF
jgi:hypothetical protein